MRNLVYIMDNILLQLIFISVGILFIIIALFIPKNNSNMESMIEKMFEDFIMQIDLENEDMLHRIKQAQSKLPQEILTKVNILEQRIKKLEKDVRDEKEIKDVVGITTTVKENNPVNQKYIEVLKLYNDGYSIEDIVEKTLVSHAEVKLILELKKKDFNYV